MLFIFKSGPKQQVESIHTQAVLNEFTHHLHVKQVWLNVSAHPFKMNQTSIATLKKNREIIILIIKTSNEWKENFQRSSPTPQYLHLPSNIYKIKQLQYAREREKKKNKIGTQESSKCVFCVNLYCKQTFTRYLKCAKEEPKIWLVFIRMWCYWGVNAQSWNMKTQKNAPHATALWI